MTNLKSPIWSAIEPADLTPAGIQPTKLLCRMVPYENESVGIKRYGELEMPIYNRYFYIDLGIKATTQIGGAAPKKETFRTVAPTLRDLQDANMGMGRAIGEARGTPKDISQRDTGNRSGQIIINSDKGNSRVAQARVGQMRSTPTEDKLSNLIAGASFMESRGAKAEDIKTESARTGAPAGARGGGARGGNIPGGRSGY